REGGVHEALNRRHAAVARRQLQRASAGGLQLVANAPVRGDVGSAEAVNRLLRIADDEELAADVAGEELQDFGLNRIGVLELVDEDARELLLQVAHIDVVSDQIARSGQEIGEVERPGRLLQLLIARRRAGELLLQTRGQVGVRIFPELLKRREQRVARRQHVGSIDALAVLVAAALSRAREAAVACEIDEPRFPAVQIELAERLLELNLADRATHGFGVDVQVVARRRGGRGQRREVMERRDATADLALAIERRAPPRVRKIAPFGERASGVSEAIDRAGRVAPAE